MSYKSSDGKEFTNPVVMKQHEARIASPGGKSHGSLGAARQKPQDYKGIAHEHGPAEEVTIRHEGDKHTVSSIHPDGHMHESEHKTADEAHTVASYLADAKATAEGKEQPKNMPPDTQHQGIPGLM